MSKLIVGCGYVGHRLAQHWLRQGDDVFVTTRSLARAELFRSQGLTPILLDVTQDVELSLPPVETMVFAVGFDRSTGHSIDEVYVGGLRNLVTACPERVRQFIYVSSIGVYGQTNGDWVDEQSPCEPQREGGKACFAAEQLMRHDEGLSSQTTILRLAGIYGPDRLPQAALLRRGEPLHVAADAFLNLIHVDDIVRIIAACEVKVQPPITMCVSDGRPVRRHEFYCHLAQLMGVRQPVFQPPLAGSTRAARAKSSKRIRNELLIETLELEFLFPSYREGLAEIVG